MDDEVCGVGHIYELSVIAVPMSDESLMSLIVRISVFCVSNWRLRRDLLCAPEWICKKTSRSPIYMGSWDEGMKGPVAHYTFALHVFDT